MPNEKKEITNTKVSERLQIYLDEFKPCSCKTAENHRTVLKASLLSEEKLTRLVDTFKALSDPNRLQIISLLKDGNPRCLCEVETTLKIRQPTVSHHVKILEKIGLVTIRKEGKWLQISLKYPSVVDQITTLLTLLNS